MEITEAQVTWLASTMAARMLADAGGPGRRGQLADRLRDWFPDGQLTINQLHDLSGRVGQRFVGLAGLIDNRTTKLAAEDPPRAVPLPNCNVIT